MANPPGNDGRAATRRRPPWLVIGATLFALSLAGGAFAAYVAFKPQLTQRITEEAKKRGVELVFSDVEFWWWSASLSAVRFRLVGVPGIEGTAASLDVALSNFEPRQIDGTTLKIAVTGSAADLALAVSEWTKAHPQAFVIPVSAHDVSVAMRPSATENPWLTIEGGELGRSGAATTFSAKHALVGTADVGAVTAAWTSENANVTMNFGAADPKAAPLSLVVRHAAMPPTATVTLAPTDLGKLTGPLGVPLPVQGVTASGTADMTFSQSLEAGPVSGTLSAKLDGWVPPHPVELDGFLFGKTTTFTSNLDVDAARTVVRLTQSRVVAGAFDLSGNGRIDRFGTWSTIQMNMSGNLPCSAVAESAAAAHVGTFLSEMVGAAARRAVSGSVSVRVRLSADTRNLAGATVEPTIGVGCGLAPLHTMGQKVLERLPSDLQNLAQRVLPPLPEFELPTIKPAAAPKAH